MANEQGSQQDVMFTREIDRRIIDGYIGGWRAMIEELAQEEGIAPEAIARRGECLGMTKDSLEGGDPGGRRGAAARECLRCERTFLSFGIQNRLCRRCRGYR